MLNASAELGTCEMCEKAPAKLWINIIAPLGDHVIGKIRVCKGSCGVYSPKKTMQQRIACATWSGLKVGA